MKLAVSVFGREDNHSSPSSQPTSSDLRGARMKNERAEAIARDFFNGSTRIALLRGRDGSFRNSKSLANQGAVRRRRVYSVWEQAGLEGSSKFKYCTVA
jgi:hypothetical protein